MPPTPARVLPKLLSVLLALAAQLSFAIVTPVAADMEAEALALIDTRCEADGGNAESCACSRDAFRENVLRNASTPEVGLLAAVMRAGDAGDAGDAMKLMEAAQSAEPEAMTEAAHLVSSTAHVLEDCLERDEPQVESAELPEGDTPRARFIRQCADDTDAKMCSCLADEMAETLSPQEFELMVEMRAAEARGEEAIAELARDRGLTVEEAKQGLAQTTGRIARAIMAIDPMSCVEF